MWDGGYWSLVVSCFVHLSFGHLAFNVYWLWVLGGPVERTLGRAQFLAFALVGGFVGAAFQLGATGETGHGASGIGYALFGLLWASRSRVPEFRALCARIGTPFWIWLVGCIVATRAGLANVGNAGHVGGLLFGLLVSPWLVVKAPRWRLALCGSFALVAMSVVVSSWSPWSSRWQFHRAYEAQAAGDYVTAIDGYRRGLALDGTAVWAWKNLALAYHAEGAESDYESTFTRLRAIDPAAADDVAERVSKH